MRTNIQLSLLALVAGISKVGGAVGEAHIVPRNVLSQSAAIGLPDLKPALRDLTAWAETVTRETNTAAQIQHATSLLRECAESGDGSLVEPLGRLAYACSERTVSLPALEALDAQRRLGLPMDRLLEMASDHARRPYLAACAALVAGQSLDPGVLARLQLLEAEAAKPDTAAATLFERAVSSTKAAMDFRLRLERLDLDQRLSEVGQAAVGGYHPYFHLRFEPILERADPVTVFARAELERLSSRQPTDVARMLHKSPLGTIAEGLERSPEAREELLTAYRDWIATFLAPASLAEYRALRSGDRK